MDYNKKQLNHNFSRLEALIGIENLNTLSTKKILLIGCGGVGGYVCEGLVRSGIGHITLIDYDIVDITNINRQIIALQSTIGKYKVDLLKTRIKDINPDCKVTTYHIKLTEENMDQYITKDYDYVIDACDTVSTKKALIKKCLIEDIYFISSMGTAKKMDPSKLYITDIRKTSNDPLARIIRKFVKDERLKGNITVLCSTELPHECSNNILGSTAFVPSSAGLLIASYVINQFILKDK